MNERFGLRYNELLSQIFRVDRADRPACTPVLIRIGAVCDHAQRKPGPLPYLLGLLVPAGLQLKHMDQLKSELELPMLVIDEAKGPVRLIVNARFQVSMVVPPTAFTPLFRIREQMLTMIAAHAAGYQTRPGIVKLPG